MKAFVKNPALRGLAWALLSLALSLLKLSAAGELYPESESQRASVALQARVETDPQTAGEVLLRWAPASREIISTSIYRHDYPLPTRPGPGAEAWGEPLAILSPSETEFTEPWPPEAQGALEYRVVTVEAQSGRTAYGYALLPKPPSQDLPEENKLLLILCAEADFPEGAHPTRPALGQYIDAIQAEGWLVKLREVPAAATVASVKDIVRNAAESASGEGQNLRSLLILGRVPVPYSGNFAPDGHVNHWGAWPTDLYYADLDGQWPDERDFPPRSADAGQHNLAGDGKFDLNELPGSIELSVGRVDFSRLGAEGVETRLDSWLERAAAWHRGELGSSGEVLLNDLMPEQPEAFASTPWRLAPLLNGLPPLRVPLLDFAGQARGPLFAFGYAPGTYSSAHGLVSTEDFLQRRLPYRFVFLFGSYFGDWDSPGNLLQAALANPGGGALASAWAARPAWQLHPLAAGYTIGECQRLTANRTQDYLPGLREAHPLHLALLGDPTLHLYPLPQVPAPVLEARTLRWEEPARMDATPTLPAFKAQALGWQVFGFSGGAWKKLNSQPLPLEIHSFELSKNLRDGGTSAVERYQVRLLYRLETPLGTMFRLGPGRVIEARERP